MSTATSASAKRLPSFSALSRETFEGYWQHRGTLIGYSAWLLLPTALHILVRTTFGSGTAGVVLDDLLTVADIVLSAWVFTVIALATPHLRSESLADRLTSLSRQATKALGRVVLSTLAMAIATMIGLAALVLPGLFIGTRLAFAPLAIAFGDAPSVTLSLMHSNNLVRGQTLAVFGRLFGFGALLVGVYLLPLLILFLIFGIPPELTEFDHPSLPLHYDILVRVIEIILFPLLAIFRTVLYLHLRKG